MRKQRIRKLFAYSAVMMLAAVLVFRQLSLAAVEQANAPALAVSGKAAETLAAEGAGAAPASDEGEVPGTPAEETTADAAPASETPSQSAGTPAVQAAPAAGNAQGQQGAAGGEVPMYPVTAVTKALENEQFILYIDDANGNVRVVSKRTGAEWLGAPVVPRTTMPNNKKFMDSPVHIKFTEGADITSTYSLKDKETTVDIQVRDDAVRLEFAFGLEKISFAMEYRLTASGLEVTIPYDSIKEEGKAKLISIEPLPFMNAAAETDKGAMLLPDGSGALMHFRQNHPMYLKGYSEMIYGPDHTFVTQTHDMVTEFGMRANTPRQLVGLPVFGIYRNGVGTLGIVTEGEYDARINGTPAGIRAIPLYRSSVEFLYRKNDVIFIGSSGQIPYYQGARIQGDRKVRFDLLEGEKAGYVGMASVYRDYLMRERGVQPVNNQTATLSVKLLGGILRDEIIGSTFIRMTTFQQAKSIIDALQAKGADRLEITLDGWTKNGLYGNQPDHFPVARQLGGGKGLEELVRYAKERGVELYLRANYVRASGDKGRFNKRQDAIRGIDREVLDSTNYNVATRWTNTDQHFYFMKPKRVYERRIAKELDDFASLGVSGIQFQYMGDHLYSDEDPDAFFSRAQTAGVWTAALREARQKVGKTAVDYGFAYTFGAIDRIDNVPLWHSGYVYTDEAVPFYQLAIHGLIPYYASPANLREDSRKEFLRAIEYGALPSFELTYAPTSDLQRTLEDRLFSSRADDWINDAAAEFGELLPLFEAVAGQQMTGHEQPQPGVYRTTYANGVQVIVNYNAFAVQVGGMQVEAMDFAVTGVKDTP